jgi:hypothetical protein
MKPALIHVPLQDILFNRCKSDIAAIEGTFAGAACLVPEFWDIPGTIKYNSQETYYEGMRSVLSGEVNIVEQNRISWEYIMDVKSISKVNELRVNLIKSLV